MAPRADAADGADGVQAHVRVAVLDERHQRRRRRRVAVQRYQRYLLHRLSPHSRRPVQYEVNSLTCISGQDASHLSFRASFTVASAR